MEPVTELHNHEFMAALTLQILGQAPSAPPLREELCPDDLLITSIDEVQQAVAALSDILESFLVDAARAMPDLEDRDRRALSTAARHAAILGAELGRTPH